MRKNKPLSHFGKYHNVKISSSGLNVSNYISTENMKQDKQGVEDALWVPDYSNVTEFRKDDILISTIRPYFKKIWIAGRDGGASSDVLVFRVFDKKFSEYIYNYLSQDIFFEYAMMGSKGSKMPRADKDHLLTFPIIVLEEDEMIRSANYLNNYNKKIELNNKIISELESLTKLIYEYWFIQFDFPDENGKPYKSSGGKMVWNEKLKREIPEGWEVQTLLKNDISKIVNGGVENYEGTKEYLATADINENGALNGELLSFEERPNRANMTPVKNSVWVAKMADSPKRLFFTENSNFIDKYIISTGMFAFTSSKEHYEYLMMYLFDDHFERLKNRYAQGATQRAINQGNLNLFPIIIPEQKPLNQFHVFTKDMVRKIEVLKEENKELEKQRDFFLPLLMNGQVTIK